MPRLAVPAFAVVSVLACTGSQPGPVAPLVPPGATASPAASVELNPRLLRRFRPLRPVLASEPVPAARVDLGRMLYFDPRLSDSQTVSCSSCHPLDHYGVTDEPTSKGVHGKRGVRNAPSTYNAAGQFRQFWDGRAPTVEEQAKGPIVNPAEMGLDPMRAVAMLESIPGYLPAFEAAFPGEAQPITWDNLALALGAFERGLVTPSRWDRYLTGDKAALTDLEKEGGRLFTNLDCLVCHTGELVGGATYEKLGRFDPWPNQADRGRQSVTGDPSDAMRFKVPSLRNVARTGPYFHDGSARTLEEAVRMMATYQLGKDLEDREVAALVAFLGALTGEVPEDYIAPPALPPSGSSTPRAVAD